MTAAALLRRLEAATGPRDFSDMTGDERYERVAAWHATRNLLPQLADYLSAGSRVIALARPEVETADNLRAFSEALTALEAAERAINAAAAKEGAK